MKYQVSIIFSNGGMNRFEMSAIPCIGDEVALVHGDKSENLYRINKVRHRAYRCDRNPEYSHESAAIAWADLVDSGNQTIFPT
jgi:hypothetical protein